MHKECITELRRMKVLKTVCKALAVSLAALLAISPLGACKSSNQAQSQASGQTSKGAEEIKPVKLKAFMSDPGFQAKNYGNDPQSKEIIKKTGGYAEY